MSKLYSEVLVVLVVCTFVTARTILGNENAATESRNKRENSLMSSLIRSRMRRQLDLMSGIPSPAQFMNMTGGGNPANQFMNMTGGGNMIPSQAGSFFNQIPGMQGIGGSNNGENAASSTEAPAAGSRKKRQLDFASVIPAQFMNMTGGGNPANQFMNMTGGGNMIPSQAGSFFNQIPGMQGIGGSNNGENAASGTEAPAAGSRKKRQLDFASVIPAQFMNMTGGGNPANQFMNMTGGGNMIPSQAESFFNQIPGMQGIGGSNNGENAASSTEAPAAGSRKKRQLDFSSVIPAQFMNMTGGGNPASQFMNMTGGGNMIPGGSCFNASGLPINQIPGMQGIGGAGGSNNGENAASSTEAPAAGSRKKRQLDFASVIPAQFMNMTGGGNPASQFMNMTGGGNMIPGGSCFNASGLPINQIPGMQGIGGAGGSNNGENAASSTEAPAAGSRRRRKAPSSAVDMDGGERRRRDLIDELPVGANPAGIASSMQSIENPPDSEDSVVMGSNPVSGFAEGLPSGSQPGGIASAMQPPPNNYLEGDF